MLYRSLLVGEFCSVLNARQMGKSSLVVQTIKRLRGDGIICITLDLSDLGSQQISLEQWYGGGIPMALEENLGDEAGNGDDGVG